MEEQLIRYETAKLAKDKGFTVDNHNKWWYNSISKQGLPATDPLAFRYDLRNRELPEKFVAAPTQSLLQKWLRESHNLHINIFPHFDNYNEHSGWEFTSITNLMGQDNIVNRSLYDTYEQALEEGLLDSLTLIK